MIYKLYVFTYTYIYWLTLFVIFGKNNIISHRFIQISILIYILIKKIMAVYCTYGDYHHYNNVWCSFDAQIHFGIKASSD